MNIIKFYFFTMFVIIPFLFGEKKARDIISKALENNNETREITYEMKIEDAGSEKVRLFFLKNKKKDTLNNTFIRFFEPASMRGTGFLIKNKNNIEHQWIYLSAFKLIRKLDSSEKNNSFMGSDFTNSDISGIKIDEYSYTILKEDDNRHIIQATPSQSDNYYKKLILTVDKKMGVISGIIFYNEENKPLKVLKNTNWLKKENEWIPQKSFMSNLIKKTSTTLTTLNIKIGIKIIDNIFEPDSLTKF